MRSAELLAAILIVVALALTLAAAVARPTGLRAFHLRDLMARRRGESMSRIVRWLSGQNRVRTEESAAAPAASHLPVGKLRPYIPERSEAPKSRSRQAPGEAALRGHQELGERVASIRESALAERQHAVDSQHERTPAGAAFNAMLVQVIELNRHFTTAAEALTKPAGQTLTRWLVLAECKDAPATVAEIARRLRLARQGVQRVATVLEREGLCVYKDNPRHRRARLLALTPKGRKVLGQIEAAQREWSDTLGERIGEATLGEASAKLARVLEGVEPLKRGDSTTKGPVSGTFQ